MPESTAAIKETWNAVQDAAIMLMRHFLPCAKFGASHCPTCDMVMDLLGAPLVRDYMARESFASGLFEVGATLCDRSLGWDSFTRETFHMQPNMCRNHVTAIPAANHAQLKYFKTRDVYDTYYDEVVRLSRVGDEVVARFHESRMRHGKQ